MAHKKTNNADTKNHEIHSDIKNAILKFREDITSQNPSEGHVLTLDDYTIELRESIIKFRECTGLSQDDISILLDYSQSKISRIESGKIQMKAGDVFILCRFSESPFIKDLLKHKAISENPLEKICRYIKSVLDLDSLSELTQEMEMLRKSMS